MKRFQPLAFLSPESPDRPTSASCVSKPRLDAYRYVAGVMLACALGAAGGARADTATPTDLTSYYRYDDMRRVTMMIGPDPDGVGTGLPRRVEEYEYDANGRLKKTLVGATDATDLLSTTKPLVAYDAALSVTYEYDGVGNRISEKTTVGQTQYSFDRSNRLECVAVRMAPDAATTDFTVGACSQTRALTAAGGPDRITKNTYDAAGRLTNVEHAYQGGLLQPVEEVTSYGDNGEVSSRRDANRNISTYAYDGFDRLIELWFPSRTLSSTTVSNADKEIYGYDKNGNRTGLTKRDQQAFVFGYDALNRQVLKNGPGTAGDVTTAYNLASQVTLVSWPGSSVESTYDKVGRRISEKTTAGSSTLEVSSRYDPAGNRTHVIWGADPDPAGQDPIVQAGLIYAKYTYNNAGGLKTITDNNGEVLETFAHDAIGRASSVVAGNNVATSFGFSDATGLLDKIHHDGFTGGTQKIWQDFGYNSAGQIVSQTQTNPNLIWTGQPSGTTSFTYNGLNQDTAIAALANAQCSVTDAGYDCNGNLKVDVDAATNATRRFTYDAENRLIGVSKATGQAAPAMALTLAYDPMGRLLKTTAGTAVTRFLYDGDQLIGEYDGLGNRLRRYVHGVGVDNPLVWFEGANGADRRFLHTDRQGSVAAYSLSDASAVTYAYGPYGEAQSWAGSRFRYTGQIALPEAELYYYKARVYDARTGRFLQTDPIGYGDGLNLYAYVGGDPLNNGDPTGTERPKDAPGPEMVPPNRTSRQSAWGAYWQGVGERNAAQAVRDQVEGRTQTADGLTLFSMATAEVSWPLLLARGANTATGLVSGTHIDELIANGVKFSPEALVATGRSSAGQVVFLETGSARAGLAHIVAEHGADFASIGVLERDIPGVVMRAVTEGKLVGYQGRGLGRGIYEIALGQYVQRIAVSVGSNGYIVGANPAGRVR